MTSRRPNDMANLDGVRVGDLRRRLRRDRSGLRPSHPRRRPCCELLPSSIADRTRRGPSAPERPRRRTSGSVSSFAPHENVDEATVGKSSEKLPTCEFRSACRRTGDAAEESRALSRRPEGNGLRGGQLGKRAAVDDRIERGWGYPLGKPLCNSAEAVAAVATRLIALLAEIRNERVDLAALVRHE